MSDERTKMDDSVIRQIRAWLQGLSQRPVGSEPSVIRTIDALTAERDAARAELATLREKIASVERLAEQLERDQNDMTRDPITRLRYVVAALAIRAALGESEATG
jgi:hypothetical protein